MISWMAFFANFKVIIRVYIFYQYYPGVSYAENHMAIYFDKSALISQLFDYFGLPQEVAINLFNTLKKFPQASEQVLLLQLAGQRGFIQYRITNRCTKMPQSRANFLM